MKYNKSKTYLFPLLAESINVDFKFIPYIENTFLQDSQGTYENCFYIMHDFNFRNPEFTHYEHKFIDSDLYETLYDIDNKVMYVFRFPDEFLDEYQLYKEGKYSEFGEDSKQVILEFWTKIYGSNVNAISFLSTVKKILYKDESLRLKREKDLGVEIPKDAELGNFVDMNDETYKLEMKIEDDRG